jgi:glycine/D-amino acid oxidase-like deaminating enzyme
MTQNISVDVAIVGGGIAGITTAYLLSRSGKSVALLEDGYIGSGETGRTTAHITHALDDRYYNIEKKHGTNSARLAADSHTKAIDSITNTVGKKKLTVHLID